MLRWQDQVVVVTGASSGIGRATALAAAQRGASVALLARRDEPLHDVAQACRDAGGHALELPTDVTVPDQVDAAARETVGQFGRVDAWVNNAAVNLFAPVEEAPVDDWHRVIATDVFGTFHGMRAAVPWLREQDRGVVVNVSSVLGKVGSPYQSAYVASKHAVRGLSAALRQELRDARGIHVCTVLPGPIDTPLFQQAGNYTGKQLRPLQPVIRPERVARGILGCVRRHRREVAVGWSTRLTLAGVRLVPGITEALTGRLVAREHFADEPAAASPGNVHVADPAHADAHGGWRDGVELDRPGALS